MPEVVSIICGIVALVATCILYVHTAKTTESNSYDYWYDFWNYYYQFTPSHNSNIDAFIIDKDKKVNNKLILENGQQPPGYDTYYIDYEEGRVGVIKTYRKENNAVINFYKAFSTSHDALERFRTDIWNVSYLNQVDVMSIDTSADTPSIKTIRKIIDNPKENQQIIINEIMTHYQHKQNTKAMLNGVPGVGKTYIGRLLKYQIERENPDTRVLLFDDFNPSSIGVNVNTMILSKATKNTPVILIVNEIDTVYHKVINGPEPFDHRLQHSRNKQSFNDMLDNIGDAKYVIALYTTEQSSSQLLSINEYTSFLRKGRVDMFITMTHEDSVITPVL